MREQLEVVSAREQRARKMIDSQDQLAQEWHQAFSLLRGKVRRVAQDTARMGLDYQQLNHEDFFSTSTSFCPASHHFIGGHILGFRRSY